MINSGFYIKYNLHFHISHIHHISTFFLISTSAYYPINQFFFIFTFPTFITFPHSSSLAHQHIIPLTNYSSFSHLHIYHISTFPTFITFPHSLLASQTLHRVSHCCFYRLKTDGGQCYDNSYCCRGYKHPPGDCCFISKRL